MIAVDFDASGSLLRTSSAIGSTIAGKPWCAGLMNFNRVLRFPLSALPINMPLICSCRGICSIRSQGNKAS